MKVKRTVTYRRKIGFLDTVQYIIGIAIAVLFGVGLIPGYFGYVFPILVFVIIVQAVISLVRLRILNLFIELFMLVFAIIGIIPYFGYLFRFIGVLAAIIDLTSFKNYQLYKHIEIRTFKGHPNKGSTHPKNEKKIRDKNVVDAEFKEK